MDQKEDRGHDTSDHGRGDNVSSRRLRSHDPVFPTKPTLLHNSCYGWIQYGMPAWFCGSRSRYGRAEMRLEERPEGLACPMEADLHRVRGDSENVGDLVGGELFDVSE
jgi:hypothetical protein